MPDLLLAHGYFVCEDPKELQIMKLYAPLRILYLCSLVRKKGFDGEVFDTTFSNRELLFRHLRTEKPSVLGIYTNLMTRSNVSEIISVAREAGWITVVGGPEPRAPVLLSLSTRFCLWVICWYLLHGNFRKAFRRCGGHATARFNDYIIHVKYPTLCSLHALFGSFTLRSCAGIGMIILYHSRREVSPETSSCRAAYSSRFKLSCLALAGKGT